MPKARLLDVGTGGGLPESSSCCYRKPFTLMDSIGKKVMVVEDMVKRLDLQNAEVIRGRVEELPKKKSYDFMIGRAVTALPTFLAGCEQNRQGCQALAAMVFYISRVELHRGI